MAIGRVLVTLGAVILMSACGGRARSLPIGAAAPAFDLPGTDGQHHALADFAGSRVLAVVFTCDRCPDTQRYEARLAAIRAAYTAQDLALVAINPDDPASLRLADLDHTDAGESIEDMKVRADWRHFTFPYLSAAASPELVTAFGVTALPQIFVFDQARTLRYEGRIDDSPRGDHVTSPDARNAIDAILAGRSVPVAETRAVGCQPARRSSPSVAETEAAAIAAAPVPLDLVGADGLKALRQNGTDGLLLVNFWATWCAPCIIEFPNLETTYQMYRSRHLSFVAVSVNDPEERPAVLEFLQQHHASHRNLLFNSPDVYGLQAAFDPAMPAPVPFTLLLAPNGDVLYQELGGADIPKLRRAILANLPDDAASTGQQTYWSQS
jgi:thiol-disulfide isomerase/thioredoxin